LQEKAHSLAPTRSSASQKVKALSGMCATLYYMIKIILLLSQFVFAAPSTQNLEGTYTKSCYNAEDDFMSGRLEIQGSKWTLSHIAYEDKTCETPYLIYELRYDVNTKDSLADMTTIQASYTSLSDVVTGVLNQIQWCGFTDWKTNEPKGVSGKVCEDYTPPRIGEVLYSIFKVNEKSQLFLGSPSKGMNGKTPATRYTEVDQLPFNKN
ncbi:MAG: hypothetical protein ACM3MG_11185, partial [Bacillota bacterium]